MQTEIGKITDQINKMVGGVYKSNKALEKYSVTETTQNAKYVIPRAFFVTGNTKAEVLLGMYFGITEWIFKDGSSSAKRLFWRTGITIEAIKGSSKDPISYEARCRVGLIGEKR